MLTRDTETGFEWLDLTDTQGHVTTGGFIDYSFVNPSLGPGHAGHYLVRELQQ